MDKFKEISSFGGITFLLELMISTKLLGQEVEEGCDCRLTNDLYA